MILFIFEGAAREPAIFRTMEYLFFKEATSHIICSYGNNIYNLYKEMTDNEKVSDELFFIDIVSIMQRLYEGRENSPFCNIKRSDISEVYLFFRL